MKNILSYFYLVGETIEDEHVYSETALPFTLEGAEVWARLILEDLGGGHVDVFYSETDEFAFDVEV